MSEHTPRPWQWTPGGSVLYHLPQPGGVPIYIAQAINIGYGHAPGPVAPGNKALLQFAPDLLAACETMLAALAVWAIDRDKSPHTMQVFADQLRAAIAKAKGKSDGH